ncbi:unnamed protein product, partial [marine sediment metagenome]
DPLHDPHGDPIPTRELHLPLTSEVPLSQLRPPQDAEVRRVRDGDPELLRYLSEMGIKPQARLEIIEYSPFDNNLQVRIEGREEPVVLGPRVTNQVYVELVG